jgi:hypothetical protein
MWAAISGFWILWASVLAKVRGDRHVQATLVHGSAARRRSFITGKSQDAPQLAVGMNGRQMCAVHDSTPGFFTSQDTR